MGDTAEEQLMKRLSELSRRAEKTGAPVCSPYLTTAEQNSAQTLRFATPYLLTGGYEAAERKLMVFHEFPDGSMDPSVCLQIAPKSEKFAEELTHRDYFGALMHLGIKRETLGDLCLREGKAWLFCLPVPADHICENLVTVRHTAVVCTKAEAPEILREDPPLREEVVSSERLDAVISAVYRLSRGESKSLFTEERVFINGRTEPSPSRIPAAGSIVSVRGFGRFRFEGIQRETKKGRLRIAVRVY